MKAVLVQDYGTSDLGKAIYTVKVLRNIRDQINDILKPPATASLTDADTELDDPFADDAPADDPAAAVVEAN